MPSTPRGHLPDKSFPQVRINDVLWEQIRRLIPQSWFEWEQMCMGALPHYKMPVRFPFSMGVIQTAAGPCRVEMVDGDQVMIRHDMDFEAGANGYEDPRLCPKDVILLDTNIVLPKVDGLGFNLYHETSEGPGDGDGKSMAMGWSYDRAHVVANAKERILRMKFGRGGQ